ncbi:hypothetical protein KY285_005846 [Solanum tuberosum]|nr:hypothetical protein KY289_006299 [Solanum tuberosum]KAH0752698.1 hypothetical protein KY285_005846 [Solanum tuberosum]
MCTLQACGWGWWKALGGSLSMLKRLKKEEDEDSMDKDGNELDGECSRPQKHAKSPELAREFLLDAATLIFKEQASLSFTSFVINQVEKAFREGTARQNAHSIFVCLALKLLEERIHVACKEIVTLEKQEELSPNVDEESNLMGYTDSVSEAGEVNLSSPLSANDEDDLLLDGYNHPSSGGAASKYEPRHRCDNFEASRSTNRLNKPLRSNAAKSSMKDGASKFAEKLNCSNIRKYDRYESSDCSCNQHSDDRAKLYPNMARGIGNNKPVSKLGCESDISKPYYGTKYNQVEYVRENCARPKSKMAIRNNLSSRDSSVIKKVWEPMELRKKYPRSSSDSDVTLRSSTFQIESTGIDKHPEPSISNNLGVSSSLQLNEEKGIQELRKSSSETKSNCASGFHLEDKSLCYVKEVAEDEVDSCLMPRSSSPRTLGLSQSSSSNSDNCSSCLSEGDSATSFSNPNNSESSSTSDSEDCSKNSEGRETSEVMQNAFAECYKVAQEKRTATARGEDVSSLAPNSVGTPVGSFPTTAASTNANVNGTLGMRPQSLRPPVHS